MSFAQISPWLHAILHPLKYYFDEVENYHDVLGALVLPPTAAWAVWVYWKSKRSEEASRLHTLFTGFYLDSGFRRLRNELEFDYDGKLRPLVEKVLSVNDPIYLPDEKELLCDLDTSLNYFEFLLHLEATGHITRLNREAIFKYWYDLLRAPHRSALQLYIGNFDYGELSQYLRPTPLEEPSQIAFYGTLMHSEGVQEDIGATEKLERVGRCSIRGLLYDLGDYPGLVNGDGVVVGELFRVRDRAVFAVLDEYEEFVPGKPAESPFVRQIVELLDQPTNPYCWVYIYNRRISGKSLVANGDWARRLL